MVVAMVHLIPRLDIPAEPQETLAAYVRRARQARGVSWDHVVRCTGLSLSAIRKVEEGRTSNPGVFTVLALWDALALPLESLSQLHTPGQADREVQLR